MSATRKKFKTEVQQLLDLVIHSLYSNRDIFLRELISNASDAVDRARFEALSRKEVLEDDPDWKIKLVPDKAAKTLTLIDNGIGMTAAEVEQNIGTIASSGTRRFLTEMKEKQQAAVPELIGQFGVGFYSAFMVADKVTVVTRPAGDQAAGTRWESEGDGAYTLEACEKAKRGTEVTLHLKEGMEEYLDEWKIRKIVTKFSDFVEHPVTMDITREETPRDDKGEVIKDEPKKVTVTEETLNSRKAIWQRPKAEITKEEYTEFYHHISHDFQNPLEVLHWNAEGTTNEFRALVFLPEKASMDFMMQADEHRRHGIQLYVKRIFISDNCEELLPNWLRFLRGVVDSSDLPLNISRELLQDNKLIRQMRNSIIKKVLDTLAEMKEKERDKYAGWWNDFGRVLKEGVHTDMAQREKLQELLLFPSAKTEPGKSITLAEYVAKMPAEQKEIYYASGDSRQALENSPHLEAFKGAGFDVLFLTDPIDDWVIQDLHTYKEKSLQSVDKGGIELPATGSPEEKKKEQETQAEECKLLLAAIKLHLGDKIKEVTLSQRLTDSACCLVSDQWGMGVRMEKIMKTVHKDLPPAKRILEINAKHPLIQTMQALMAQNEKHPKLVEYSEMLYDQALLTAGLPVEDLLTFTRRISALMAEQGKAAV